MHLERKKSDHSFCYDALKGKKIVFVNIIYPEVGKTALG